MADIKSIIALVGVIIGAIGFLYGFFKDRQIRLIEKRSKAPHFIPRKLEIDSGGHCRPQKGDPYYSYRKEAAKIDEYLCEMEPDETSVPDDYPDNRVVSILVKNDGSRLRFFKVVCDEKVMMRKHDFYDDHYEIRYFLSRTDIGKSLPVKVAYETEAGLQGTQVWSLVKGQLSITRLKPKTV